MCFIWFDETIGHLLLQSQPNLIFLSEIRFNSLWRWLHGSRFSAHFHWLFGFAIVWDIDGLFGYLVEFLIDFLFLSLFEFEVVLYLSLLLF